jgi:hypothetical protein
MLRGLEQGGGVVPVTARGLGERAAQGEVAIRWGRPRRGVFAGCGHRRFVGGLAGTAVVRNVPSRLCGVVPRQVDRVSIRRVRYDESIDRI